MSLRINQNVDAFNSYRNLSVTQGQMSKSLEKLSSGFRINRAADDAAGLAISESLRSQVGGLKVAVRNAQDGISVAQTAEGALTEVHAMLQRMRDLTVQAGNTGANGGAGGKAVASIQEEISALSTAINDIATRTEFNGTKLLGDTDPVTAGAQNTLTFQVGANGGETQTVTLSDMTTGATGLNIADAERDDERHRCRLHDRPDRHRLGDRDGLHRSAASSVRLRTAFEHTVNNLNVAVENLSASESRIRDTDMAQEMMNFTRSQILSQAGTSMLAQANQAPQGVLALLR